MLEVAALFYGVIASFIMASAARNRREARGNPRIIILFGWFMLALSAAMGALLLGAAGWQLLTGGVG